MMNLGTLRTWLGAISLGAAAVSSQAAVLTLDAWTYGTGQAVNVSTPNYNGAGGAFSGTLSGAGAHDGTSFVTYCVQLTEYFQFHATYSDYAVQDGAAYFGSADIADRLGRLITVVGGITPAGFTSAMSGSLQLAIWNTIYDTDTSVDTGAFRNLAHTGINAQADAWLAQAATTTSDYAVSVLARAGTQDFLVVQRIPEPATLALVALALAGAGAASRRRRA